MSYHWENTIWQSKDGTWNRGFFKRIPMGDGWSDEDYDSEWDDEFDFSAFDYLRTGFPSEAAAFNWQPGANPGSHTTVPYAGNSKECKHLDQLARWHLHPEEKAKHDRLELLRKNREHFKNLQTEWTPEAIRSARANLIRFDVEFKQDEAVHTAFGISTSAQGNLFENGDWLEIMGKRVYNLKTDKFEKNIHSLRRSAPRPRFW